MKTVTCAGRARSMIAPSGGSPKPPYHGNTEKFFIPIDGVRTLLLLVLVYHLKISVDDIARAAVTGRLLVSALGSARWLATRLPAGLFARLLRSGAAGAGFLVDFR